MTGSEGGKIAKAEDPSEGPMASVSLNDLRNAYEWSAAAKAGSGEGTAYVSLTTGAICCDTGLEEDDPRPDDLDDETKHAVVPSAIDLDLGRRLVSRFVGAYLPDDAGRVEEMFRHRGAFRRFEELLIRRGRLDAWHSH